MQAKGDGRQTTNVGFQRLTGGTVVVAIIFVALVMLGVCGLSGLHVNERPIRAMLPVATEALQVGAPPCPPAELPSAPSPALSTDRVVRFYSHP